MKKIALLMAVLVATIATVNAQTLDEVLAKHFKAVGQDKLAKVKTFSVKAEINQMGMELPMTMKMKKPGKFWMSMDMQGQNVRNI